MRAALVNALVVVALLSGGVKECACLSKPMISGVGSTSPIDHSKVHNRFEPLESRERTTRRVFMNRSLFVGLQLLLSAATRPSAAQAASLPFFPARFDTVDHVPKEYFDNHRFIYAFCERIVDGDTIRVRHIPGYNSVVGALTGAAKDVQPLTSRGIADQTLIVRLYGVDAPEVAKPSNGNVGQPFAQDAKDCTSSLVYHQVVKVTFLKKDQYRRAVCLVETLPRNRFLSFLPGFGPRDVSVELAAAGLVELYTGGGAEYNVRRFPVVNFSRARFCIAGSMLSDVSLRTIVVQGKREDLVKWIDRARRSRRGIWSLKDDERVSAADFKRDVAANADGRGGPANTRPPKKRKTETTAPLVSPSAVQ